MLYVYDIFVKSKRSGRHVININGSQIASQIEMLNLVEESFLEYEPRNMRPIKGNIVQEISDLQIHYNITYYEKAINLITKYNEKNIWFNEPIFENTQLLFQLPYLFDNAKTLYGSVKLINILIPFVPDIMRVMLCRNYNEHPLSYTFLSPIKARMNYDSNLSLLSYESDNIRYVLQTA